MAKKNYTSWNREELIKEIEQLRKRKKYGLVWEDNPEDVVIRCKSELPVLVEVQDKEIITDKNKPINLLIEGDNFHALSVLNYTHKGKIDIIYIDPPYNTGAKDWKYNNDFVDGNDLFRHSKWISMMNNRLQIAKKLLRKDGVLICAIDDNEQAHLGVLLEELFHGYELHCITIIHNPGGVQGKNFSYNHEYAYFVFPKGIKKIGLQNREHNPDIRPLRDVSTGDHLRTDAKNCFYPIYVRDNKVIGFGDVCDDDFHPESINIYRKDGVMEIYPIDTQGNERKWVFARQTVDEIKDELTVEYNRRRKIYDIIRKKTKFNYKTVWDDKMLNANLFGTQMLTKIISTKFPFPKSLYAVKECISAVIHRKEAIILDFFAGSGTTGHALLELNKNDAGNRQFILCTNNENDIATDVTYPRLKNVILGYNEPKGTHVDGLGGNLKYFKTAFVHAEPTDKNKTALTKKATEMLCIKEVTFEVVKSTNQYKIFRNNKHYTGIIFDHQVIDDFKKQIKNINGKFSLYIFSLGDDTFDEEFKDMKNKVKLSPIPEAILRVYRRIFK
jgi:adenine-specific DNA-methyltransferase